MSSPDFKAERDSLAFFGLLSHMYKTFDEQVVGPGGKEDKTHNGGLNIHALIVNNADGQLLALKKNAIHASNNPMLHAEQLSLKAAIEMKNHLEPRNKKTTSVESYYRNFLFNDPNSLDALRSGATIYTTLEPCPFCTSALLVTRMKRIVYITPDVKFGSSFYSLWANHYRKNDVRYEQMTIDLVGGNSIVEEARRSLGDVIKKIGELKDVPGTLFFDSLKPELANVHEKFATLNDSHLTTTGVERENNSTFLRGLKKEISF